MDGKKVDYSIDITENRVFSTEEVANEISTGTSTVRKYCLELEKYGYSFKKDNKSKRIFVERDLEALRRLVDLRKRSGISLENAASIVANSVDEKGDLRPLEKTNFDVAKGSLERKMFLDFQEEMQNALAVMQQGLESRLVEENRSLKNEVILLRESFDKKMLESESQNQEQILSKIVEENKELKIQTEENNKLIKELLKEKAQNKVGEKIVEESKEVEKKKPEAIEEPKPKGFFKRLFGG